MLALENPGIWRLSVSSVRAPPSCGSETVAYQISGCAAQRVATSRAENDREARDAPIIPANVSGRSYWAPTSRSLM